MSPAAPPEVSGTRAVGTTRVVVCDDQDDVRQALREVIGAMADFDVIGEAATGPGCLEVVGARLPDLLVLDVNLPGGGPTLAATVRERHPQLVILVFSAHHEPEVRQAMLGAGADDFVVKTGRLAPLREALLRHAPTS